MTRHALNPDLPIMAQVRSLGLPEHLPHEQAMLYRFFDAAGALLYVGVTVTPRGRWQGHRRKAAWWPMVSSVSFETYPHERAALDAEVAAIRSEDPLFNKRSAPAPLRDSSCAIHEDRMRTACTIPPRVGGGVGVGGGCGVLRVPIHAEVQGGIGWPVDNSPSSAPLADRWMAATPRGIGGGRS